MTITVPTVWLILAVFAVVLVPYAWLANWSIQWMTRTVSRWYANHHDLDLCESCEGRGCDACDGVGLVATRERRTT